MKCSGAAGFEPEIARPRNNGKGISQSCRIDNQPAVRLTESLMTDLLFHSDTCAMFEGSCSAVSPTNALMPCTGKDNSRDCGFDLRLVNLTTSSANPSNIGSQGKWL